MQTLLHDSLAAWRTIVRQPRAAIGAILLLGLAIGVSSAMFAVVDAFIVRPAPFRDPDSLVELSLDRANGSSRVDLDAARALRDTAVFETVLPTVINAPGQFKDAPRLRRSGAWVPPGSFRVLGVSPLLGREFVPGEGVEGNADYVLLSEAVWRSVFDADPAIVGKVVTMNDVPTIVVGVMPAATRFPINGGSIWRPLDPDRPTAAVAGRQVLVYARVRPGMPVAAATSQATTALSSTSAAGTVRSRAVAERFLDDYSKESITSLAIGVGLVFILLCANVTNLVLARATARRSEYGLCSALGASRGRLLRQAVLEQLPVGVCATLLGLGLSAALVALAQRFLPEDLLWRTLNPLDVDLRTVIATSAAGFLAVLLAGVPAAWLGTRTRPNDVLAESTRGSSESVAARRTTRMLLVIEVAMSVAVLASAGLHLRSFLNLVQADRGIDADRTLAVELALGSAPEGDAAGIATTALAIEERLATVPGIARVNRAPTLAPDGGSLHFGLTIPTGDASSPPVALDMLRSYSVTPGFFETFGVDILEGRAINTGDDVNTVVFSERLADAVFGDRPAVGQVVTLWKQPYRVVGVAEEIRNSILDPRQDHPEFYRAHTAPPTSANLTFALRCGQPCARRDAIVEAVRGVAPLAQVSSVRYLSDDFMAQLTQPRTAAVVALAFAGLALLATAVGLYGVLALAVVRRRRELGIRAALGAGAWRLRRLVIAEALTVTVIGIGAGLGAGWLLGKWMSSVRFGVTFLDPATWAAVVLVVATVAVAASWRPARRAMRSDPVSLLRET